MLYFYTEKRPIKLITLVLPHQTHLGTENTLFLPKKTPDQINYPVQFSSVQSSCSIRPLWKPLKTNSRRLQDAGNHSWKHDLNWNPTVQFSSVQFSSVQSSCSIRPMCKPLRGRHRVPGKTRKPHEAPKSEAIIQIPLFYHTKRTSEPKIPYFYLKNARTN